MKKISLIIVLLLVLVSCEKYDFEEVAVIPQIQTRAEVPIADFDPVTEFANAEIPANIVNVGNTKYKYVSCQKGNAEITLASKDDGSGKQQWLYKLGGIVVYKGIKGISSQKNTYGVISPNTHMANGNYQAAPERALLKICMVPVPSYLPYPLGDNVSMQSLSNGNVALFSTVSKTDFILPTYYYLSSTSSNSTKLKFVKDSYDSPLSQWKLVALGEYELVDLQYARTSVDNFDVTTAVCDQDEYTNSTSTTQTWDYSVSMPYTETSTFSSTEGVSTTLTRSTNVGLPNILGLSGSITSSTTFQQQSSHSFTYGESTQQTITRTRTAHITVPAHTQVRMETTLISYNGVLTYVATLKNKETNKTFRVKGKWSGNCFSKYACKVYEVSTNNLIQEIDLID